MEGLSAHLRAAFGTPHWSSIYKVQLAAQDGAALLKLVILCSVILSALCPSALQALFLLSTGKQTQDKFYFLCRNSAVSVAQ